MFAVVSHLEPNLATSFKRIAGGIPVGKKVRGKIAGSRLATGEVN